MEVKEIKVSDDLEKLTLDIKSASWDEWRKRKDTDKKQGVISVDFVS